MTACLIGLGSNLGDRLGSICRATERLAAQPHVRLIATSRWHQTRPVGGPPGQPPFLNAAAVVETSLGPESLHAVLARIESDLGRVPGERWGPRSIDLDLLLYGNLVLQTPTLIIPHPRMAWRRFVLEPAAEVAASMPHPTTGWTIGRLLEHLNTALPYVAITGAAGAGKTSLAERLARQAGAALIREPDTPSARGTILADPSGSPWASAIKFLETRAQRLRADLPEWSQPGRLWVSDFWFGECLALGRVVLPAEQCEEFRRRWEEARPKVVAPKLTVCVDVPAEYRAETEAGRIGEAILAEAGRPGHGPVLPLSGESLPDALREVLAAIEAMQ